MTLRALLVDLDDTLHDKTATASIFASRLYQQASLDSLGINEQAWLTSFVGLNDLRIEKREVFSRLRDQFKLPPAMAERFLNDFDDNFGTLAVPFPGAKELLRDAKSQGLLIGMITNGRDAFQRSKVCGLGLSSYFDCILTSGAFGTKKPASPIFMACLASLGVAPQEAAFVGDDHAADIQPAWKLGMIAIWKSRQQSDIAAFSSDNLYDIRRYVLARI
ncbi:MAG: HAD-IA family hydrolase [Planctomycetota bacterium]